jgi:hypothetical protein
MANFALKFWFYNSSICRQVHKKVAYGWITVSSIILQPRAKVISQLPPLGRSQAPPGCPKLKLEP